MLVKNTLDCRMGDLRITFTFDDKWTRVARGDKNLVAFLHPVGGENKMLVLCGLCGNREEEAKPILRAICKQLKPSSCEFTT
jgi:hypothetical protein